MQKTSVCKPFFPHAPHAHRAIERHATLKTTRFAFGNPTKSNVGGLPLTRREQRCMRWRLVHGGATAERAPRSRFAATNWYCDGSLWLFSGIAAEDGDAILQDLWRFDTAARLWSHFPEAENKNAPNAPAGRLTPASWVDGFLLCMYGGWDGCQIVDDRWDFDVLTGQWSRSARTERGPGPRSGSVTWSDGNDHVWLFGGVGGHESGPNTVMGDLWAYSVRDRVWHLEASEGRNLPPALTDPAVFVVEKRCWLFGGLPPFANDNALTDLWAFDRTSGTATNYSLVNGDRPSARLGAAFFSGKANDIYVFGGLTTGNKRSLLNDLWRFNPTLRNWMQIGNAEANEPWPSPRQSSSVWADEFGRIWLFGGSGLTRDGVIGNLGDLWLFES